MSLIVISNLFFDSSTVAAFFPQVWILPQGRTVHAFSCLPVVSMSLDGFWRITGVISSCGHFSIFFLMVSFILIVLYHHDFC